MGRWDSEAVKRRVSIPRLVFFLFSISFVIFTIVSAFMPDPATSATVIDVPGLKKPLEVVDVGV